MACGGCGAGWWLGEGPGGGGVDGSAGGVGRSGGAVAGLGGGVDLFVSTMLHVFHQCYIFDT